jgi:hypothetical protein
MMLIGAATLEFRIFFSLFGVTVIGTIISIRRFQNSRGKKNLTALADRLRFSITPDLRISYIDRRYNNPTINPYRQVAYESAELGIAGQLRGRSIRFSEYKTTGGKSSMYWAEIATATRASRLTFSLQPEHAGAKLAELLGQHENKIGDEEFDRRWRIFTNEPAALSALLVPELRAQINESAFKAGQFCNKNWLNYVLVKFTYWGQGEFYLNGGWLRYREGGHFSNEDRVTRYESMVGLMCDLAEATEVAAEKFSPPSPSSP